MSEEDANPQINIMEDWTNVEACPLHWNALGIALQRALNDLPLDARQKERVLHEFERSMQIAVSEAVRNAERPNVACSGPKARMRKKWKSQCNLTAKVNSFHNMEGNIEFEMSEVSIFSSEIEKIEPVRKAFLLAQSANIPG